MEWGRESQRWDGGIYIVRVTDGTNEKRNGGGKNDTQQCTVYCTVCVIYCRNGLVNECVRRCVWVCACLSP